MVVFKLTTIFIYLVKRNYLHVKEGEMVQVLAA